MMKIITLLYLNEFLFATTSNILIMPDFTQVCEFILCCSSIIPIKANYTKDKFYHVISKEQLEIFSKNIQDVLVGSLLGDGCISKAGRGPNPGRGPK
nr:hypothetical protein [Rhizoctonia sp.]